MNNLIQNNSLKRLLLSYFSKCDWFWTTQQYCSLQDSHLIRLTLSSFDFHKIKNLLLHYTLGSCPEPFLFITRVHGITVYQKTQLLSLSKWNYQVIFTVKFLTWTPSLALPFTDFLNSIRAALTATSKAPAPGTTLPTEDNKEQQNT